MLPSPAPASSLKTWTAEDEARKRGEESDAFVENPIREVEASELVEEWKARGFGGLEGFDERAAWSLRAVGVSGPFEVRVDEKGHEFVVEVGKLGRVVLEEGR